MHVAPEPDRHPARAPFDDATERITRVPRVINSRHHPLARRSVRTSHRRLFDRRPVDFLWHHRFHCADLHGVAMERHVHLVQQALADGANSDPRRRLACARPL